MLTDPDLGKPVLSVVTPLFNEEGLVPELVNRVVASCGPLGVSFEFLIVNDGSQDRTLERLVSLSAQIPQLKVINLFRNFGHMPALSAGVALAKGDGVIVMDGDLQDPPEMIPDFFQKWRSGADVVYGLRTRRRESFLKRRLIALFYWCLQKTTEAPIPTQAGTFCLMDRRVVDIMNHMGERDRFFAGLRAWIGGKQSYVSYERPDRPSGRSRVGAKGMIHLARAALISFSKVPLRYASLFSLLCGLILFLIGVAAIVIRLTTHLAIPGWATFTTLLGMMGFVQSLVLAVISEYIAVIFEEVKARPLFLVREIFAHGKIID